MSGIRTIEDVRDRCRVDDITGCWIWAGAYTRAKASGKTPMSKGFALPVTWYPALQRNVGVWRVVLHLRGVELTPKIFGWTTCRVVGCCAPDHVVHGTQAEMGAAIAGDGIRKGLAVYAVASRLPRKTHTAPEVRAQVLESEESGRAVAQRLGISTSTVSRLRRRQTYQPASPASVFGWRG
jgi:hypothetical protein